MEWNRDYRQAIDFVSVAVHAPGFSYPTNDFYKFRLIFPLNAIRYMILLKSNSLKSPNFMFNMWNGSANTENDMNWNCKYESSWEWWLNYIL